MTTKKVEITLTATTCVQYVEVVEVPSDITADELQRLVNDRYQTIGGDEFSPVGDTWERGDCGALDAPAGAEATVKAVRVRGGLLAQDIASARSDASGLPFGELSGRVVCEEDELDFEPYLFGRIEVPYRTSDDSALPERAGVEAACRAAIATLRSVDPDGEKVVFPLNRDLREGHCVITVAVPVYQFDTDETAREKLAKAFQGLVNIEAIFEGFPEVNYLTNACGEHHSGEAPEEILMEVPFENGPGFVLPYLVELYGKLYVMGNLEVAYRAPVWEMPELHEEAVVEEACRDAIEKMRAADDEEVIVFPLDYESMPERCVISVAIPVAVGDKRDDIKARLQKAFMGFEDINSLFEPGKAQA